MWRGRLGQPAVDEGDPGKAARSRPSKPKPSCSTAISDKELTRRGSPLFLR